MSFPIKVVIFPLCQRLPEVKSHLFVGKSPFLLAKSEIISKFSQKKQWFSYEFPMVFTSFCDFPMVFLWFSPCFAARRLLQQRLPNGPRRCHRRRRRRHRRRGGRGAVEAAARGAGVQRQGETGGQRGAHGGNDEIWRIYGYMVYIYIYIFYMANGWRIYHIIWGHLQRLCGPSGEYMVNVIWFIDGKYMVWFRDFTFMVHTQRLSIYEP